MPTIPVLGASEAGRISKWRGCRVVRAGTQIVLGVLLLGLGAIACGRSDADAAASEVSGEELAARHCQSCHLLPDPAHLDRGTWQRWVLPRMARRLGLQSVGWIGDEEPVEGGEAGRLVREAGVFPDTPRISYAEWSRISAYFVEGAPDSLPPPPARPPMGAEVPGFRPRVAEYRIASPMITLVKVDPAHGRIYVGDATPGRSSLVVLDGRGRAVDSVAIPSPVSHLRVSGDTLSLLLMGMLHPSDAPRGSLRIQGAVGDPVWEVDGLRRPVHASYADLSGDGVEDAVISEFGHLTGRLAWYERLPGGGSRRHVLAAAPGSLTTFVDDFDGDGYVDVLALIAQGDEQVTLFRGRPGGGFAPQLLVRFPPSYGSTSIELRDLDHDGDPDIVHTSGDSGDYPANPKPYHGVRIFLNDGRWRFEEAYFFPLHGAFKAVARDFDGDGDVDIAAIAFYPDFGSDSPESFVYLQNTGGLRFTPYTFGQADRGRWLTLDAGDVDGDGDEDLVLGSFAQLGFAGDQRGVSAPWREPDAPAVMILENVGSEE